MLSDLLARVWLSLWVDPGDRAVGSAVNSVGAPRLVERLCNRQGQPRGELFRGIASPPDSLRDNPDGVAREALARAHAAGTRVITPADSGWPRTLNDLGLAKPLLLFVSGSVAWLNHTQMVAIVGTRRATAEGVCAAEVIARDQASKGRTVVTGGARGIDISSHRAASCAGGATVIVLAAHHEHPYPAEHRDDFLFTSTSHAVVCEMPPGRPVQAKHFLARNRMIAALTSMTILVEAGYRSGAVNTCRHAAHLGRTIAAVQWEDRSPGSERVLTQYAAAPIPWPG